MKVTRRDFIGYCGAAAASLGIDRAQLDELAAVLEGASSPRVVWMHGSTCSGCTVSFLNRISSTAPRTAADVLVSSVNLMYHPTVMAAAGDLAVAQAEAAYNEGGYILVVEGGVPMNWDGQACVAWNYWGVDVPFQRALVDMASRAKAIVCVGTCAAFGGVPASGGNPTGVRTVKAVTGKTTINIPGCPVHPDWIVWGLVQIITGRSVALDSNGRPTTLFSTRIHSVCPRREADECSGFGTDGRCFEEIGCKGESTYAPCASAKWNGGREWCIGANAPCLGCVNPNFPTNPIWK